MRALQVAIGVNMRNQAAAPGATPGMIGNAATDHANADQEACHA
ncbi:hypothetical protein LAUMK22_03991 [Mycobacterium kansasii]|uniref:Uncharacterized protein n=2 Tax=Mycobacterium kansasii TaxID=1768 RepID=A0A1V3XMV6_MYCKA|nr:hypothetical protein MKAN_07860 [Mycobacterium kansasii ATCC 12478]EUA01179.1 hypothetical protein I547_3583 [Mycobacterium kansasii 824]KEP40775.1 hypothetical protein MKSMC1_40950 [Mycobacterium kansasii]OOK78665.1 hypothetical protein BZL30_2583 [Mycobacterium kansasii]OOK80557.1 hypothetical protein BZL29_2551 [Mycobacterium kansasii]